jgi:hypothetical protein
MTKYRIIIIKLLEEYEKRLHRFVDYFYDDEDQYKILPVPRYTIITEEPSEKELELLNQLYVLLPEATDEELKLISENLHTHYDRSWYNLTPLLQERLKRGDKEAEEKQAYLLEWNSITDDTWDGVDDGSDETPEAYITGQGDDLTWEYKQFDSTPLGGIDLPVSAQPKDILNIVVNYANNRTEDYFDIQIRLLSDEGNSTRINVCARKEGESAFPYMYIDAENTDFSPKYLLRQLKQLLPDQEWRYTYMDDAEVIHNQEEL